MDILEFGISKSEIKRRISAFTALLISLYLSSASLVIGLYQNALLEHWQPALIISAAVAVFFFWTRHLTQSFFKRHLKTKVIVGIDYIERRSDKFNQRYRINDIAGVSIKTTSREKVRDIGLTMISGESLHFDGLENFKVFKEMLINKLKPGVKISEAREPLDYDSILFYPILGVILSIFTLSLVKFIGGLGYDRLKLFYLGTATYVLLVGLYFFIKRPLTITYGPGKGRADMVFGWIFIIASVLVGLAAI